MPNLSAGRFPDGADTDNNRNDFRLQTSVNLSADSAVGANNIKVVSVADFGAGQTVIIDTGANRETAVIAAVGTAGGTTVGTATDVGATVIPVPSAMGFGAGQTITIDSDTNLETAVVATVTGGSGGLGGFGITDHCRRAAQDGPRGGSAGLRDRPHPHLGLDQAACQRGAGRQPRSHARRAQPEFQQRPLKTSVEPN